MVEGFLCKGALPKQGLSKVHCILEGHLCTRFKNALPKYSALFNLVQRCPSKIQCTLESLSRKRGVWLKGSCAKVPSGCPRVTPHMWMRHVALVTETCHRCEWVTSHMWLRMSHVPHVIKTRCTCQWVMSYMWMSHVITHVWMRHVALVTETCHKYEWVTSYI